MYGIAHCLIDRDGRVIGCNLPIGNGPLLEQAPAMAQILRAFAAQSLALGYCPSDFRVVVRRLPPQVSGDTRLSYAVHVIQLGNGVSLREADYVGGDGADWVDQLARCAAADFPSALKPVRVSSANG